MCWRFGNVLVTLRKDRMFGHNTADGHLKTYIVKGCSGWGLQLQQNRCSVLLSSCISIPVGSCHSFACTDYCIANELNGNKIVCKYIMLYKMYNCFYLYFLWYIFKWQWWKMVCRHTCVSLQCIILFIVILHSSLVWQGSGGECLRQLLARPVRQLWVHGKSESLNRVLGYGIGHCLAWSQAIIWLTIDKHGAGPYRVQIWNNMQ